MEKAALEALKALMASHGNLERPIPPGALFAVLPTEETFRKTEALASIPYPPLSPSNPGCEFNPSDRTLKANLWGRVIITKDGIKIRSSWRMSQDKMSLSVDVNSLDFEGQTMTLEAIKGYLPQQLEGLKDHFDYSGIVTALEDSKTTGKTISVTVAEGTMPAPGHDGILTLTFQTDRAAGTLREDGTMDFRERAHVSSVEEGDALGEYIPTKHGSFGYDLFGNPIKPPEVKSNRVKVGEGVVESESENGHFNYTSNKIGTARLREGTLEVIDTLKIEGDVDYTTGNIHASSGSIHVKGDVKAGFVVECDGDVFVDGIVEDANIISGGLVIAGGVIMSGNNWIVSKGDVSAHFFRNAIIKAEGDVTADQEIAHCTVDATGKVTVLGSKGHISGGRIISGDDIQAPFIGNKACGETHVEIRMPSAANDQLREARGELKRELKRLNSALGADFELSSLMKAPEEDRRILAELVRIRTRIQTDLRNIDESFEVLQGEAQQAIASKRVIADKKAYCGVKVVICGKGAIMKKDVAAPKFYLNMEEQRIAWS